MKKKGQLTQRDVRLIEFCENSLPISTDMAAILFYPNRYIAQRRLTVIHNLKQLKRTERLYINQPYIYYHQKKDLKFLSLTKLLCDLQEAGYLVDEYRFDGKTLNLHAQKEGNTFLINATLKNLRQVYQRLKLLLPNSPFT